MNYQRYIRFFKRFVWMIIVVAFLAGLGSYFFSTTFLVPQYQVTSTVLVYKVDENKEELYYGNVMANEKLIGTFRDIASSRRILEKAIQTLSLPMTINELSSKITINIPSNSQILSITVRDPQYSQAIRIANAMAYSFQSEMRALLPDQHVVIIDLAKDIGAIAPISPNIKLNVVLGTFLGLIMSTSILFAIEYLRAPIRSELEAQEAAGVPVLVSIGKIPKKLR